MQQHHQCEMSYDDERGLLVPQTVMEARGIEIWRGRRRVQQRQ